MIPSLLPTMPQAVILCWRDACYHSDHVEHRDLGDLVELWELGWVIAENEESITLCAEWQDGAEGSRLTLTVPKVNIVWMKKFPIKRLLGKRGT